MATWTNETQPFGSNRAPLLVGLASDGTSGPIPLAVDAATGRLLTSTTGGGSAGVQYAELATTSPATGTLALGRYQTSLPTLTNFQMNEPMLDSSSRLLVNVSNTSLAVTGTFFQATQSVSGTVAVSNSNVIDTFAADATFTITLASLAASATVGRQSTLIDNTTNRYSSALVYLSLTTGTTPTANTPIYVYLIRSNNDNPIADDGAGTTDAAITINNSPLLGVINVPAATSNTAYVGIFDTSLLGPLGPKWGIAIVNNSGAALNSSEGAQLKTYIGVTKTL